MYIDGVNKTISIISNALVSSIVSVTNLNIGTYEDGIAGLNGLIDEVVIYDQVLTQSQVTYRYNGGTGIEKMPSLSDYVGYFYDKNDTTYIASQNPIKIGNSMIFNNSDAYSVAWTDYGSSSTIVGFSGTPTVNIWYKRVGKIMFVNFIFNGTSNSVNFTFTLPYSSASSTNYTTRSAFYVTDNAVTQVSPGQLRLPSGSNIVTLYKDWTGVLWTASGNKQAEGQFWYQIQ